MKHPSDLPTPRLWFIYPRQMIHLSHVAEKDFLYTSIYDRDLNHDLDVFAINIFIDIELSTLCPLCYIYIYIYIYMCVCVCVCVYK